MIIGGSSYIVGPTSTFPTFHTGARNVSKFLTTVQPYVMDDGYKQFRTSINIIFTNTIETNVEHKLTEVGFPHILMEIPDGSLFIIILAFLSSSSSL